VIRGPRAGAALLLALFASGARAESAAAAQAAASNPREAMQDYLDAADKGDYARAARRLDLSAIPEAKRAAEGPVLARHLKVVLDRTLWVDLGALSDSPEGSAEDGLPAGVDRLGSIPTSRGSADILLDRTVMANGVSSWRIGGQTVRRIPALYAELGFGRLGDWLPSLFFTVRFLDVELWQWVGLAAWLLVAWIAATIATRVLNRITQPLVRRTASTIDDQIVSLMAPPIRLAIALAVYSAGATALELSAPVHTFLRGLEVGAAIAVVTWGVTRLVDVAGEVLSLRFAADGRTSLISSVGLARKTLKAVLVAMAAVGLLHGIGFNVAGIVAGLGVGGLAVALAAQKTVENLFGGLTLAADRPVRVGDFCRWGDKLGTIEDVGLRSTRIRTLDRTIVTVPNAMLSQMEIENFAPRDAIRLQTTFGLRYETTPDQLRFVLAEAKKLLVVHPMIAPQPARVRFAGFGASSLDVEIFAYVRTSDFNVFLSVREDVLLRIMDLVERAGTGFAFPSQTLYLGRDTGLDPSRSREAVETVRRWRENGVLPFPDPSPEDVAAIEDSLEWPPAGAPVAGARG